MASKAEAEREADYESDLEDVPLPSMRRREASDDEDGEGGGSDGGGRPSRNDLRAGMGSDGELEGQGGAQVYDEEEEEEEEDEEYYDEEEDELGEEEGEEAAAAAEEEGLARKEVGHGEGKEILEGEGRQDGPGSVAEGSAADPQQENDTVDGEEKKENEPFAVPTTGAFYMHDDRFQERRNRRMFGGRKLWDPKDERAWVHDRFEEMNLQDSRSDEESRRTKGRFRGRGGGRRRDGDRGGYARGGQPREYQDDSNDQNRAPRTFRGRGPRRYESLAKSNREIAGSGRIESPAKPQEIMSTATIARHTSLAANHSPNPALPRKHTFASSLNSASPPFYPSRSSNQDTLTQKRYSQSNSSKQSNTVQTEDNLLAPQSSSLLRGKAVMNPVTQDKMHMDDNLRSVAGKDVGSYPQSSGYPLSTVNVLHSSSSRIQGRGLGISGPPRGNQTTSSLGQVDRFSEQAQMQIFEQRPTQIPIQPARVSTKQFAQRLGSENQASLPQLTAEVGENGSPPGSNMSKTSLVAKGKTNNQGIGRGSFLYGGAQVIGATGAMGLAHGDQNFPGTPALLPVMHFGNQNPGGLGVQAVGMALPGYVGQPQLGFGNSEMTWMPILAGAPGALGAPYCSPYIALDENYYPRPTGQSSSSVSTRETSTNKPASSTKPSSNPEVANEELVHRQNKPRRYSEMSFGQ